MIYDITRVDIVQLDKSVFPPTLDVQVTIKNNSEKILPVLIRTSVYLGGSASHPFYYLHAVSPPLGEYRFDLKLVLEYVAFLRAKEDMGGADPFHINIVTSILTQGGTTISEKTQTKDIDKATWILAQQEENKPKATGIMVYSETGVDEKIRSLEDRLRDIRRSITDDPLFKLQQRIFSTQLKEIKQFLLAEGELKELSNLKPIIDISNAMKISSRWSIAASILSSLEGFMKNWLVRNSGETYDNLKKKEFDELIHKMREALKAKGITFEQKKLSDLAGKRHFRNQVIHEMYEPTEGEIDEITKESIEFVNYIESLKP